MSDEAAMPESNFSPFSRSGLRRRILAAEKDENQKKLIAIITDLPSIKASQRELKSAITPTTYKRDALLKLSQTSSAVACASGTNRLALTSLLTATAGPTAVQLGFHVKGASVESQGEERAAFSSMVGGRPMISGMKTSSYNPVQFDREKYAAKYAAPFTTDPSLMKPVDMSQWTPSVTSPLVTPFGNNHTDVVSVANSDLSSIYEAGTGLKDKEILRPSAKVFIPTETPILKSNPQPQRDLQASIHASKANPREDVPASTDRMSLRRSMINSPAQSTVNSSMFAPFEVPKALTPLASPSANAGLPPRPIACAVAPNLPRWAQSPGHAMLASLDLKYGFKAPFTDAARSSMIRRASPPGSLRHDHSMKEMEGLTAGMPQNDDSQHFESGMMSAVTRFSNCGSMTPWARQRNTAEIDIKGDMNEITGKLEAVSIKCDTSQMVEKMLSSASTKAPSGSIPVRSVREVKPRVSFDGDSWRERVHQRSSWANQTRKPSLTPSIPGGLLGAVPMHSVTGK